jgi:hypothetical protein
MKLKPILMKGKKWVFHPSVLGLSISLFTASALSCLTNSGTAQTRNSVNAPTVGTIESMVTGDIMCYVTLVDENGIRHKNVGATFEICQNKNNFLNKQVNLVYKEIPVNDCQSVEPCGKTRLQTLITQMTIRTTENNPNGHANQPEPGWSLWHPQTELKSADFTSGFSNSELGGFLDFQSSCAQALGTPTEQTPYWFRLSNLVNRIGTGKVEFGCWANGRFITTMTNTAVSNKLGDVNCLRVNAPTGRGLSIRSLPGAKGKVVGFVKNGATVTPDNSPASIEQADGQNWVAIRSPMEGWVSDNRPDSSGNLSLCKR